MLFGEDQSDQDLLNGLKEVVRQYVADGPESAVYYCNGVSTHLNAILRRLRADGIEEHPLFIPVTNAMAQFPKNDDTKDKDTALHLWRHVFSAEGNEWAHHARRARSTPSP